MGAWYERSALSSHIKLKSADLAPQRFWDAMDRLGESELRAIESKSREVAIEHFGTDTAALVLDATNFFTPISFSPMFHWTDDKIRVHVFYCVDALGLAEYAPGRSNTPKT